MIKPKKLPAMFSIREGDIATAVALSKQIPEFVNPHEADEYEKRLRSVPHLILVAFANEEPVGFKVGYERDGAFYSISGSWDWRKRWRPRKNAGRGSRATKPPPAKHAIVTKECLSSL